MSANTMVFPCKCKHDYQDDIYGKGNRVFNRIASKSQGSMDYKCTVCGATKSAGAKEVEKKKATKK